MIKKVTLPVMVKIVLSSACFLIIAACQMGVDDVVAKDPAERFDRIAADFDEQVTALEIPAHQLSFVDNLAAIEDVETLMRQEDVLTAQLEIVRAIDPDTLDRCRHIDHAKMLTTIRHGLRRADLANRYLNETAPDRKLTTLIEAPLGVEWYEYYLDFWNTAEIEPDALFAFGEKELMESVANYNRLQAALGFEGDDAGFAAHLQSASQFIDGDKQEIVWSNLKNLFAETYGVKQAAIKRSDRGASFPVPGYYNGQEGAFYYNVLTNGYEARQADWLLLHEASPGHHFQIKSAENSTRCNSLLTEAFFPAYGEGWAAYVETMGKDLGLYQTLEEELAAVEWNMVRSARVALDVAINAYGWDDDKALAWWKENVRGQEDIAMREIARIRRWPGQVVTYKYGADVFERSKEAYLGAGIGDVRAYHDFALAYGPMPLEAFEAMIAAEIE